jgi:hypothetical protein
MNDKPKDVSELLAWCEARTQELREIVRVGGAAAALHDLRIHQIGRTADELARVFCPEGLILTLPVVPIEFPHTYDHHKTLTVLYKVAEWCRQELRDQRGDAVSPPAVNSEHNMVSQPATLAARLRSTLTELRQLHDELLRRSGPGCSRLPDADLARLWKLDTQVEMLATRLGFSRPDNGRPYAGIRSQGWTHIRISSSNFGLRLAGGASWYAGIERLDELATFVESESNTSQTGNGSQIYNEEADRTTRQIVEAETTEPAMDPAAEIDQETQAIALLFQHKDWSINQIADHLHVDRKTPYKWKRFREAATLDGRLKPRGPKDRTPRSGYKTRDGQVEAYADKDEAE